MNFTHRRSIKFSSWIFAIDPMKSLWYNDITSSSIHCMEVFQTNQFMLFAFFHFKNITLEMSDKKKCRFKRDFEHSTETRQNLNANAMRAWYWWTHYYSASESSWIPKSPEAKGIMEPGAIYTHILMNLYVTPFTEGPMKSMINWERFFQQDGLFWTA